MSIPTAAIEYPETDGLPMAENTIQFDWIVTIKEGIGDLFRDDPNVFVAGDLFWYPVEGDPNTRAAPDTMVVFGRPKGPRRSYLQWEEGGIAPQVVFEVLSPSNRPGEMERKRAFYEDHGVEEYYVYDPDHNTLEGWLRDGEFLAPIEPIRDWTSPRLGIRFECTEKELRLVCPDGTAFETVGEIMRGFREARARLTAEQERAETEHRQRLIESERADAERAAKLVESERADAERAAKLVESERADAERAAKLIERQRADAERAAKLIERQRADAERAAKLVERQRAETEREAKLVERQRADAEREAKLVERQRAETEREAKLVERQRADAERQRADAERQRADQLAARLRALGLDPETDDPL